MSAPTRSAPGREIAGAPKLRLTQSYVQCVHTTTIIERMPQAHVHHARELCADCGAFIGCLPKPETVERRKLNAFRLAKLAMCDALNPWQCNFIRDVSQRKTLSPRQQAIIDELAAKYLKEAA